MDNRSTILIFFIILGLFIFGLIWWWIIKGRIKVKNEFEQIAAAINGIVNFSLFCSPKIQANHQGIPYRIKYMGGRGEESPPQINIEIFKKPPFKLSLRKEDFDTKISKKIGLAKEVKTGIADFDEEFFIQSNNTSRCLTYLSKNNVRDSIKNLYDNYWTLNFTKKKIETRKYFNRGFSAQKNGEEILNVLKEIDLLIINLE